MSLSLVAAYGSSSEDEVEETQQEEAKKVIEGYDNNKDKREGDTSKNDEKSEKVKKPLNFQALPMPLTMAETSEKRKPKLRKKKKKKKDRRRERQEKDEEEQAKINILSLKFEKRATNRVIISKIDENSKRNTSNTSEGTILNVSGVGPQRPSIDYNIMHDGAASDKITENTTGDNHWKQSFGSRYMDRDVQNYVESGGDISKLAEHPQFAQLNAADIEKEAKLKAVEISAEGSGTAGMGEDRPATSTFWNAKEGKITTGFLNKSMGKRKHQIGTLVQEAEQFEAELERAKAKSRKGMQRARNMYGF